MKRLLVAALTLVLLMAFAAPALAVDGSGGAGKAFGQHHAEHARAGHLGADMNPGMHTGFAGYDEHHSH